MKIKKVHTDDCLDANDDTSVLKGKCICPKPTHAPTPLKKGMRIKVYSDPITKREPEGEAILDLKEQVADNENLQYWSVKFKGEDGYFLRWIDPIDAIAQAEGK